MELLVVRDRKQAQVEFHIYSMTPEQPNILLRLPPDDRSEEWSLLIDCWLSLQHDGYACNAVVVMPDKNVHSSLLEVAG